MTPDQLVAAIEAEKCTLVSAVPTLWAGILQVARAGDVDLSSVRMGTSGGAAIPRSLVAGARRSATASGSSRAGA